jgi:hypothetical protein
MATQPRPCPPPPPQALLEPLEREGVLVKRSREDLGEMIPNFTGGRQGEGGGAHVGEEPASE